MNYVTVNEEEVVTRCMWWRCFGICWKLPRRHSHLSDDLAKVMGSECASICNCVHFARCEHFRFTRSILGKLAKAEGQLAEGGWRSRPCDSADDAAPVVGVARRPKTVGFQRGPSVY